MECVLTNTVPLGAHDFSLVKVVQVHIDEEVLDKRRTYRLQES
jgi:flavin reductase (DIM6/NTAB) family NADH-FMN oxidoreductase RutF